MNSDEISDDDELTITGVKVVIPITEYLNKEDINLLFVRNITKTQFSALNLFQDQKSNNYVVLKTLDEDYDHLLLIELDMFISIAKWNDHPFIVKVFGALESEYFPMAIAMEYIPFSLMGICQSQGLVKMSEADAMFVLLEMVEALHSIHRIGIVHQDIKTDNVLVRSNGHIALCDFGISKKSYSVLSKFNSTITGPSRHLAPEVRCGIKERSRAVDFYSLGYMVFFLIKGFYLLDPVDIKEGSDSVGYNSVDKSQFIGISPDFSLLLQQMLHHDPQQRLGGSLRDVNRIISSAAANRIIWSSKPELTTTTEKHEAIKRFGLTPPTCLTYRE